MEEMDDMAGLESMAMDVQSAGEDIQAAVDLELPAIRGSFSQTAMNALVDATNMALEAAGFEGDYPEFDSDVTEFPPEFVRVLAMFADAAEETDSGIVLSMDMIEDDRDVAALASKVRQLAESAEFKQRMTQPMEAEVEVSVGPAGGPPDEEALMMERM